MLTTISSFYPHYFKNNMNKTCVRSKDNLNSVGHMPMLAGIEETQLLQKKTTKAMFYILCYVALKLW